MGKEINNNPENIKKIAKQIEELSNVSISRANGTSEASNDGLTARYNDAILDMLDGNLKKAFKDVMQNSKDKFDAIATDFEQGDKNASV